jgi:hypothetical protein
MPVIELRRNKMHRMETIEPCGRFLVLAVYQYLSNVLAQVLITEPPFPQASLANLSETFTLISYFFNYRVLHPVARNINCN